MEIKNSGKFQLDWNTLYKAGYQTLLFLLALYASNTEFFNVILSDNLTQTQFVGITIILGELIRRFGTNYKK